MDVTELPISPDVFWPLVGLAGLLLALFAVFAILPKEARAEDAALEKLKVQMGLGGLHSALFLLAILFWTALFLLLFLSLAVSIVHSVGTALSDGAAEAVRRDVIVIAGLTATLGAVVALPFTLIRLTLTRKQTTHAEDVLFNEKITEAQRDLYAQRQVTIEHNGGCHDVWEDDIVRRNAAIDQLERLVKERPDVVENVASVLSVYVRELSKREPAETPPEDVAPDELRDWAYGLTLKRSDMEKAVQTLGRLRRHDPALIIDLRDANLQRMSLADLDFEKALLSGAQLQGAVLTRAQLREADLIDAQLQGARLTSAQLQGANLFSAQLQGARLTNAQLREAGLIDAQLQGADLTNAQLQGARLTNAQLQGADLYNAQLQGADLFDAQLQGADLNNAQLQGADLFSAQLQGASLGRAQLQGADLYRAQLDETTSLTAATLRGAAVREVDFTETSVTQDQIDSVFGDASVDLPADVTPPDRFSRKYATWQEFEAAWRAWQKEIGFDPDTPE